MKFHLNKRRSAFIVASALSVSLLISGCEKQEKVEMPYIPEKETHTITFQSGEEVFHIEITPDITAGYIPAVTPKEGYILEDWTLNGEPYDFSMPIESDMTLEANWVPDHSEEKRQETDVAKETLKSMIQELNKDRLYCYLSENDDDLLLSIYDFSSLEEIINFLEKNTILQDRLFINLMYFKASNYPDLRKLSSIYSCSVYVSEDISDVDITNYLTASNIQGLCISEDGKISMQDTEIFANVPGIDLHLYNPNSAIDFANSNSSTTLGNCELNFFKNLEGEDITFPECESLSIVNYASLKNTTFHCNAFKVTIISETTDFQVENPLGTISLSTDITSPEFRESPLFASALSSIEIRLTDQNTEQSYLLSPTASGDIEVYDMSAKSDREMGVYTKDEILGVNSLNR